MFNAFEEIFAPGRKHTDEERNRLALTRVDVGDGDPGRGPIDLASGKVTVRAQMSPAAGDTVPAADTTEATRAPDREPPPPAGTASHEAPDTPRTGRPGDGGEDGAPASA
ncbi:DUF6191 domain-containing protein [Streptomyces sp. NPDC048389]|uniref:DUF6191 domain-containing protein n=1 Tax=Streptomyces sp. NPDC048389 TaxID=3154622 RepID=UPI003451E280